jgi:2-polyprenyl-3-methyl-5-hydroxy-6-metoxy-1,4-benzoquinol methylase
MNPVIHYTNCPVCGAAQIKEVLRAKDYTVSTAEFAIWECGSCTLRFTQDVPNANAIGQYYKSENYISHTNTSKGFINKLYQIVRNYTLGQKRKLIINETGVKKGTILDAGSGTGAFVNTMKTAGWTVTGLEPDEDARTTAKNLYNINLDDTDRFYQLPQGYFDAITMWHVLEHVHGLSAYIKQLSFLLKEKGKLFIAVPNYTAKDAAAYKEYWAAYDVPRHLYHFSPKAMEKLMQNHSLKIVKYKPMWFDSFYICMLSSKYKNGKTNLRAAVWNGFISNLAAVFNTKKCSSAIYIISK